ncbi:MAG: hypothetical protein V1867_05015 [Candidatus Falkowbacteria bacterium]
MIIAFDGNVFAGKTAVIGRFASRIKANLIDEHTFFVDKIKDEGKYSPALREHFRYLRVDRLRRRMIKRGINLLDRSFVSLSAHVYALYAASGIDLREPHLEILEKLLRHKAIIIPDLYVFVSCERKIAKKRFLDDWRSGIGRRTPKLFIGKKYFSAVEKFNLGWQKEVNGCRIDPLKDKKFPFAGKNKDFILPGKKMTSSKIINLTESILFNK